MALSLNGQETHISNANKLDEPPVNSYRINQIHAEIEES